MRSKSERDKAIRYKFLAGCDAAELAALYKLSLRSIYYIAGGAVKERAGKRRAKAAQAFLQAKAFYQTRIDTALDAVKTHSISLHSAQQISHICRRRLSAEKKKAEMRIAA